MRSAIKAKLAEFLTVHEAAAYLGVSSWTLRNWDKTGKLKPMRHPVNGYRIYRHEDLEALKPSAQRPRVDWQEMNKSGHFVQFYDNHQVLTDAVAEFMAEGLAKGEGGLIVATAAHRAAIEKRIEAQGIDLHRAKASAQYVALDAKETLAGLMDGDRPDPQRFRELVGGYVTKMIGKHGHLRAFGEMVALLWEKGNKQAAIRIEELWNEAGRGHPLSLYCAYPLQAFSGADSGEDLKHVCALHGAVMPGEQAPAPVAALMQMQQKASLLEAEIMHRREVEKALLKRERELIDFFKNAAVPIHRISPEGVILAVNAAELELLGYAESEYVGRPVADFHADSGAAEAMLRRLQAGETLKDYEVRLRCRDGSVMNAVISSNPQMEDGKLVYIRCFTRDITERTREEKAQALLAAVVESSQDAILSKTLEGRILSWNSGAQRLFGYSAEEMIGQSILRLIPPDRQQEEGYIIDRLKRGERVEHYETVRVAKDGREIDISLTISPVRDAHGRIVAASKVARDITEQKRTHKELQAAKEQAVAANIAKTEFLANMSHEIRTPMNAVIGLANILALSQPLSAKQKEFINTLRISADALLALINDLLDISRIEARTIELERIPFCLTQIMQEVISMMSLRTKEKGLTFTTDAEYARPHWFVGDPTRLRQIITNLCSNAVKFTERGGIHISIASVPSAVMGVNNVRISVQDTGIGIPPDKVEDIFQKFVQADTSINRKYGGTGLGLAITRMLTDLMGGSIEVESAPGKGSTFTVCLPLEAVKDARTDDVGEESAVAEAGPRSRQPRVLLVEDYAANILVASTYLEHFGYAYDLAKDGHEAVDKAKTGDYIAILMDVQMYGMNGFDATRRIREHERESGKPPAFIIGMTAHALAGDRERCLATGMDDYIAKPFNQETLGKKLATAMKMLSEEA